MPSYIRYFTFSPRHALMLTHAMCVCPILVHYCALLILYSIANLSCRSVPTHHTAANMFSALCSTPYSSNVYGDIPVQYSQLELYISTDTLYSCQYALHWSVPLSYFTLPYRTYRVQCCNSLLCRKTVLIDNA